MLLNTKPFNRPHLYQGFSLVEMAIVLAIIALLLGGLLPTITGQMDLQHLRDTRKQLEDIRSALIGFTVSNGRLPCPDTDAIPDGYENIAAPAVTNDVPLAGQSTLSYLCSNQSGKLPYNQLGINPTDIYGGTFTYRISTPFAQRDEVYQNQNGGGALLKTNYFNLSSTGTLRVCATAACSAPRFTDNAAAVVLSSGKNWARLAEYSADENENVDSDNDFVTEDPTPNYDDILVWISPTMLFNRMVAAGKLP